MNSAEKQKYLSQKYSEEAESLLRQYYSAVLERMFPGGANSKITERVRRGVRALAYMDFLFARNREERDNRGYIARMKSGEVADFVDDDMMGDSMLFRSRLNFCGGGNFQLNCCVPIAEDCDLRMDEDYRTMAITVGKINAILRDGCFVVDRQQNSLYYRICIATKFGDITYEQVQRALGNAFNAMRCFSEVIRAVSERWISNDEMLDRYLYALTPFEFKKKCILPSREERSRRHVMSDIYSENIYYKKLKLYLDSLDRKGYAGLVDSWDDAYMCHANFNLARGGKYVAVQHLPMEKAVELRYNPVAKIRNENIYIAINEINLRYDTEAIFRTTCNEYGPDMTITVRHPEPALSSEEMFRFALDPIVSADNLLEKHLADIQSLCDVTQRTSPDDIRNILGGNR